MNGPTSRPQRQEGLRRGSSHWPASGLILAMASDQTWMAALITAAAAALAFATRLNPLWMLVAGGVFGFAGLI